MVSLTDLDGVGPTRSDRLEEAGYTVESLAEADHETVAEEADVPEDTALEFVVGAQNLVEESEDSEESSEDADDDSEEENLSPADLTEPDESESSDDSEGSDDEVEVTATEYDVPIEFGRDEQYDAYFSALLEAYERRYNSHQPSADAINLALDEARYAEGSVEHSFTEYELNTVHAAVKQRVNDYKGSNMIDYMDAAEAVLDQIEDVRQAELF